MEKQSAPHTMFLKLADKCVREGNLAGALALIQKARIENPDNRYAEAYEERVQALMPPDPGDALQPPVPVNAQSPAAPAASAAPAMPLAEIVGLLSKAYDALSNSDFSGALAVLGEARQLDPTNGDITALEEQISAAVSAPPTPAGTGTHYAVVRSTIQAYCEEACDLAARGEFMEAMQLVARGFVLDPADRDLLECERLINYSRLLSDMQQTAVEAAAHRIEQEQLAEDAMLGRLAHHLARARELMTAAAFDEALTEIALGQLIDPAAQSLHALEEEIWKRKNASAREHADPRTNAETARLIRLQILAAEEFARSGDFTRALDGLAKAYVLDPTNTDLKRAEIKIRQQELRHHQQSANTPLKLIYHYDKVANGE
jgi:tetratricopeptide (TPR) repeat protein